MEPCGPPQVIRRHMLFSRNSGTPRNSGGTTEHYPEHQCNTPEQRNLTKRRAIAVFLRENLKLKI